jgi:DNA polymerase III epsilon subunit-like protein
VSIAVLRIADLALERTPLLDLLIDPGVPIPPHVAHLHGIDDSRVAGARDFAAVHGQLLQIFHQTVVIGHNVGFDLAMMAAESRRRRLSWRTPTSIDTARMVAAIDPHRRHLDLADLLRVYGIEPEGRRHNAADDARMAGELFIALARRLIGQGRGTLGSALGL